MRRLKAFPYAVIGFGVLTVAVGIFAALYSYGRFTQAREMLAEQQIRLTEDAAEIVPGAVPGALVDTAIEAEQMAAIIHAHAMEATGGRTYAEMDRDDPARETALAASNLRSNLYTASMGLTLTRFGIVAGGGVIVLGVLISGLGVALLGLVSPPLAERVGLRPAVAEQ